MLLVCFLSKTYKPLQTALDSEFGHIVQVSSRNDTLERWTMTCVRFWSDRTVQQVTAIVTALTAYDSISSTAYLRHGVKATEYVPVRWLNKLGLAAPKGAYARVCTKSSFTTAKLAVLSHESASADILAAGHRPRQAQ